MRGLKYFIVHIPNKYNETFKTDSGMQLYGDRRWSPKEMANTEVKVVETSYMYDGPITKGTTILIDQTILFNQIYSKGGEQENINLIDRENDLYKVEPELIIAFKEGDKWTGHNDNILTSLELQDTIKTNVHIPEFVQKVIDRKKARLVVGNKGSAEMDVKEGDVVLLNPMMGVDIWLDGKKLTWFRNKDLLALVLNEAV